MNLPRGGALVSNAPSTPGEKGPEAPQSVATPRCPSLQRRILVLLVIAAHMGLHLPVQAQVEPYRMQFPISRGATDPGRTARAPMESVGVESTSVSAVPTEVWQDADRADAAFLVAPLLW